jgi:hypothetical protein
VCLWADPPKTDPGAVLQKRWILERPARCGRISRVYIEHIILQEPDGVLRCPDVLAEKFDAKRQKPMLL